MLLITKSLILRVKQMVIICEACFCNNQKLAYFNTVSHFILARLKPKGVGCKIKGK